MTKKQLNNKFEAFLLNSETIMGYKQYTKSELISLRCNNDDPTTGLYKDHFLSCLWLSFIAGRCFSD